MAQFKVCNCCGARKLVEKFTTDLYDRQDDILLPLARTVGGQITLVGAVSEQGVQLCQKCYKALRDSRLPQLAAANNFLFADIPAVLLDLSPIELRLIARVDPFVTVHRLNGGQYGTADNIVNFYNEVEVVLQKLPRSIENINTIYVRVAGSTTRQHVVRPHKIRAALQWLKANNALYTDIIIDEEVLATLSRAQPQEIEVDDPAEVLYLHGVGD